MYLLLSPNPTPIAIPDIQEKIRTKSIINRLIKIIIKVDVKPYVKSSLQLLFENAHKSPKIDQIIVQVSQRPNPIFRKKK